MCVSRNLCVIRSTGCNDLPTRGCVLLNQNEKAASSSEHESLSTCLDPQLTWEDLFQRRLSVRAGADGAWGQVENRTDDWKVIGSTTQTVNLHRALRNPQSCGFKRTKASGIFRDDTCALLKPGADRG